MDRAQDQASAPPDWLDALAESDADLAAGRIVPAAVLKAELRASLARIEAGNGGEPEAARASDPSPSR